MSSEQQVIDELIQFLVWKAIVQESQWYSSQWVPAAFGSVVTLASVFVASYLAQKRQEKIDQRNILIHLIQSHSRLFSIIHKGHNNPELIDYVELRQELENTNFIFILSPSLRTPFLELYKIYGGDPAYYRNNKNKIPEYLNEIVIKLQEHGAEYFGYK